MTTKGKTAQPEGGKADQPAAVVSDVGQFAIVPTWLLTSGVSDRAVRLFACLAAKHADFKTGKAVPSRRVLAADLGCSLSSADRAIDELTEVGALTVEQRQANNGDFISNIYRIRIAKPEGLQQEEARVDQAGPIDATETGGGVCSRVTRPLVTDEQGSSHGWIGHSSPVTTQETNPINQIKNVQKITAPQEHGASGPVEKSEPTLWTVGLAIAHRVREDYPKEPGNWLSEIKARMLNQGIDANDCGPDGTKGKFFIRVWEEMLKQVKHRKGDGGVIAWRHRHAARQAGKSSRRVRLDTS